MQMGHRQLLAWAAALLSVVMTSVVAAPAALAAQPATAAAAVPVHLTMQRTPTGGTTVFERVADATVSDAAWSQLIGDYSFQADSSELQLYLESDDAAVAFHLDDVTIAMTAPPPGGPPDES